MKTLEAKNQKLENSLVPETIKILIKEYEERGDIKKLKWLFDDYSKIYLRCDQKDLRSRHILGMILHAIENINKSV